MSEPIVFISHFGVREGTLGAFTRLQRDVTARLYAEKPGTHAFLMYLDEDRARVAIIHVFPDADAMDLHFQGAEERAAAAYEFLVPEGWEIYGRPSPSAVESMRRSSAAAGVQLAIQPEYQGGFLRSSSD